MKVTFLYLILVAATANSLKLSGRIVGGEITSRTQLPYQAGFTLKRFNKYYWCGGAIISNQWVLTAAQCTIDVTEIEVWLGFSQVLTGDRKQHGGQTYKITDTKNIIAHPRYRYERNNYDIGLIKLPNRIKFNEYIQRIRLARRNEIEAYFLGRLVSISGWGKTSDTGESLVRDLRVVDLSVIDESTCINHYDNGSLNLNLYNFCLRTTTTASACAGDSGGPVVSKESNHLVGVISHGSSSGCEQGDPMIAIRITPFLDWIKEQTGVSPKSTKCAGIVVGPSV